MSILKVGIDFGGVLSIHDRVYKNANSDPKEVVGQHRSTAINMPKCLETLKLLKEAKIPGVTEVKLYVISFAGKTRAIETKESILTSCPDLFDGLYFTKTKHNKKFVCKHLGCDVMIDDTMDVLTEILKGIPEKEQDLSKKGKQGKPSKQIKQTEGPKSGTDDGKGSKPYLFLFKGDPGFGQNEDESDAKGDDTKAPSTTSDGNVATLDISSRSEIIGVNDWPNVMETILAIDWNNNLNTPDSTVDLSKVIYQI